MKNTRKILNTLECENTVSATSAELTATASEVDSDVYIQGDRVTLYCRENGTICNDTIPLVNTTHSVIVVMDVVGKLNDINMSAAEMQRIDITIAGMNKMGHGTLDIYNFQTNTLLKQSEGINNIHTLSLTPSSATLDSQGKLYLELKAGSDWMGEQSFPASFISFECVHKKAVDILEIETAGNRTTYGEGETFDPSGLLLKATCADGSTYTIDANTGAVSSGGIVSVDFEPNLTTA